MCPNPLVIKPEERISQLRPLLSDPHWKFQTANILKLIELYESGEAPPPTPSRYELWLRDGKIIEPPGPNEIPDIPTGSAIWIEVSFSIRCIVLVTSLTLF